MNKLNITSLVTDCHRGYSSHEEILVTHSHYIYTHQYILMAQCLDATLELSPSAWLTFGTLNIHTKYLGESLPQNINIKD